jgi:hypothetical protein
MPRQKELNMARKPRVKRDAADSPDYIPQAAETEAEVLSMGFPNTGDPDRDIETHMNRMANGDSPPRDKPDDEEKEEDEDSEKEDDEDEEVTVAGQTLRVNKSTAAILRAQELQLAELRNNSNRGVPITPRVEEEEPDPLADAEKTLFADPRGTLVKYGEALERRITSKLTQAYNANRATDQYFAEFYRENKDLAPLDDTVRGVLRANLAEVSALNPPASRARLAQLVRMQIDTIVKTVVPDDERREARRTTVEGATRGGTSRPSRKEPPRQEAVKSLSSVIRERKMARANAGGRTATR